MYKKPTSNKADRSCSSSIGFLSVSSAHDRSRTGIGVCIAMFESTLPTMLLCNAYQRELLKTEEKRAVERALHTQNLLRPCGYMSGCPRLHRWRYVLVHQARVSRGVGGVKKLGVQNVSGQRNLTAQCFYLGVVLRTTSSSPRPKGMSYPRADLGSLRPAVGRRAFRSLAV